VISSCLLQGALQGIGGGLPAGPPAASGSNVAAQLAAIVGCHNAVLHVSNLEEEVRKSLTYTMHTPRGAGELECCPPLTFQVGNGDRGDFS